jgi:hypothetical protein
LKSLTIFTIEHKLRNNDVLTHFFIDYYTRIYI